MPTIDSLPSLPLEACREGRASRRPATGSSAPERPSPLAERPRERLLASGPQGLSDAELLAILLRTGRPGVPVLELARRALGAAGSLGGLPDLPAAQLRDSGLGPVQVATVLASVELCRRLARSRLPERRLLSSPGLVASYLALRFGRRDQEVMGALLLDVRHRLMTEVEVFRGTLSRAAVEPRNVLKRALLADAAGILLFHTHPSGDPSPSPEDLTFTRRMAQAGEVVGVRLVDHLIVARGGRWTSLRERGAW